MSGSMVGFNILAGGFDVFISSYLFTPGNASLTLSANYPSGANPSWISGHPRDSSILYAVNANVPGAVQSFHRKGGVLSAAVDSVWSGGDGPAFCAIMPSTGDLAVVNYGSGTGRVIVTSESSASHFLNNTPAITFTPPPGNLSHPHMAVEYGHEIFIPDLGSDKVWRLSPDKKEGVYSITGFIPQPGGSGPRHMAIANNRLYVVHELASTLTVQAIPRAPNGTASIIDSVSIVPPGVPAGALMAGAEVLIPRPSHRFPRQYIYVSNRNKGVQAPTGDSIAIYENVGEGTPEEHLELVKQVFTGLDQVRGMMFGGDDSEYLVAGAAAGTGGIVMYERVDGGRDLKEIVRNTQVPTRTSFVWYKV
ncbi:unnamed protein product [Mycena citricolor]|uniref:Isomerase YbhE n=1 Tax=Mycena citricolor TaxID=2018698 RepID=A0AAD2GRY6_9AGAR|nr:unnamed protein product [Mycena citricolor]